MLNQCSVFKLLFSTYISKVYHEKQRSSQRKCVEHLGNLPSYHDILIQGTDFATRAAHDAYCAARATQAARATKGADPATRAAHATHPVINM